MHEVFPKGKFGRCIELEEVKRLSLKIRDIFLNKAKQLFWHSLPPDQVEPDYSEETIEPDKAYFKIRMSQMYIAHTRILWRKFYPMLHGFVNYGDKEEHVIVGPGQLKGLGEANLDRIMTFNYPLSGPIPYKGDDITLLVGLYNVPAQDSSEALINTIGMVAGLAGLSLGQITEISNIVKSGVENLLELKDSKINIGICDTLSFSNPPKTGYLVAINEDKQKMTMI